MQPRHNDVPLAVIGLGCRFPGADNLDEYWKMIRDGLAIVLRLLRASGRSEQQTAQRGAFQLMLGGRSAQLVRLKTGQGEPCLPEISAGKFAINIRFLRPDMDQRPRQIDSTVQFELTLCNL